MELDKPESKKKKISSNKFEWITKFINFGLIILVVALIGVYISRNNSNPITNKASTTSKETTEVKIIPSNSKIKVDLGGAIINPGVYEMEIDNRIVDLIVKAGGFSDKVDLDFVDKNINKAQKLSDGEKIYIPKIGENIITIIDTKTSAASAGSSTSSIKSSGLISINTGSKQDLIDLPEIGEVTADKIIAARPYASLDDLVKKGVLKSSSLDKIRTLIKI